MTRASAALCVAVIATLAGCTASPLPSPDPTPSATALPDGISISLLQQRSDYGPRRVQLAVKNASAVAVEVTDLTLRTDYLTEPVVAPDMPYTVMASTTINFPAVLTPANCDATAANPEVEASFVDAGEKHTARVIPTQPFDSLEVVHSSDCSRSSFERVVRIVPGSTLRTERAADGSVSAVLDVRLVPTGAAGSVTLRSIDGTILLDVAASPDLPLTMTAASSARTVSIRAIPTRCDPHVVAEDKVGTILPFRVSTPEYPAGEFGLPVSTALRNQYLSFVAAACGW
ncbi:hypothetical protein [Glaciihabitans sp. dw_435]|uniref:hypothetical protein n=1 Tax=Glaciihabitans sp. dw_435 TaxID=2720081 RepID=UPI001BD380B7|nr:hypothetical protein [Glaciihabitans sp. dw_435]